MGQLIFDVKGVELTKSDKERIGHPLCAGIILFARNYIDKIQIRRLIEDIKSVKSPPVLVCVDQEGGRVQRFKEGFSRVPPMAELGILWDRDRELASSLCKSIGIVLGAELRDIGIDLTFAPVLDLNHSKNTVIGDRSFHRKHDAVIDLAGSMVEGFRQTAIGSVGKHFPGHGRVLSDTHLSAATDRRSYNQIAEDDLVPFIELGRVLDGIMPSHVSYPSIDRVPASFSGVWLRDILRDRFGYQGLVFSDDLSMKAATIHEAPEQRVREAFAAGCNLALLCNDLDAVDSVLHSFPSVLKDEFISSGVRDIVDRKGVITTATDDYEIARQILRSMYI